MARCDVCSGADRASRGWSGAFDLLHIDTHVQRALLAAGEPNPGEAVLLVGIDAASERALGRTFGPADNAAAWRRDHARLIDRAARAGASAVVFDLFFERDTGADAELAAAARRAVSQPQPVRVIFGARRLKGATPDMQGSLRDAAQWGTLCLVNRGGGALWSTPLASVASAGQESVELVPAKNPSLALAAVVAEPLRAADLARRELRFDGPLSKTPVRFSTVEPQRIDQPECRVARAGDDQLTLLLRVAPKGHWRDSARFVSYADALDPALVANQRFKNRVVLIGAMELRPPGHDDVHVVRDGFLQRQVFGVELQADAIATLASGRVAQLPTVDRQPRHDSDRESDGRRPALPCTGSGAVASHRVCCCWRWFGQASLVVATRDIILNPAHDLVAMLLSYCALRAAQWLTRAFPRLRRAST